MNKDHFVYLASFIILIGELGNVIWLPMLIDSTAIARKNNLNEVIETNGTFSLLLLNITFQFFISGALYMVLGDRNKKFILGRVFLALCIFEIFTSIFTPYLSSTARNNPSIQGILHNAYVPITIAIRFFWLKRIPSLRKMICVGFVLSGLSLCIISDLINNQDAANSEKPPLDVHTDFLWTLAYIFLSVVIFLTNSFLILYVGFV